MKDSDILKLRAYTNSEDIGCGDWAVLRVRIKPCSDGTYFVFDTFDRKSYRCANVALRGATRKGGYLTGEQRPNAHTPFLLDERDTFLMPGHVKYGRCV